MDWLRILLIALTAALASVALLLTAALIVVRRATAGTKALARRVGKLPWRARFRVARDLARDPRVPLALRLLVPLVVLYLAMPFDIIPDFIPVLGQLDDLVVVLVGLALLVRFVPRPVILDAIERAERSSSPSG